MEMQAGELKYLGKSRHTYENFENQYLRIRRSIDATKDPFNIYVDKND